MLGLLRSTHVNPRTWLPTGGLRGAKQSRVRPRLRAIRLVLSALLIAAPAYSQDAKTPFTPVPVDQRKELASRLIDYTAAFRWKDWGSLYDLVADVDKRRSDGSRMSRKTFSRLMKGDSDWYRLVKFTPIRTEMTPAGQFDVYGCGEFPSGEKAERVAVGIRAVREHDEWFFTSWDYFDRRQPCSNLAHPAWKPSHHLSLEYLPEVACVIAICTL